MKRYRLDPAMPRRLTPQEQARLDKAEIDYSDIPPLGDQFFIRANGEAAKLAVLAQLRSMIDARGDGDFSDDEEARYAALVRQLAELDRATR